MAFLRALAGVRTIADVILLAAATSGLMASGCRAQGPENGRTARNALAVSETHSLREFGAFGDGRTDDTAALKHAFAKADHFCLDGEGRTYRVTGSLRAESDFCLRNVVIVQSLAPFDTRPFITRSCPVEPNASAVVDCGDPAVPPAALAQLGNSLGVRTLFIRSDKGTPIRVLLDHVKVVRGLYPEGGSRTDSAGIWLEGAANAILRNVEITGGGKGYGLIVLRSSNVKVDNLWVHDIVWSPYAGDAPLSRGRASAIGWNSVPVHEFRQAGKGGANGSKFYGVRVQEQVTCALFSDVRNVRIRNPRISRCMARFEDGDLPWQADGLDISQSSSNITVDAPVIDSTWEGMDVVGNGSGIDGLVINNPRVSNSFGFGLKLGRQVRDARIVNPTISNAGIAGIVLYGAVSGASISGAIISGVGQLSAGGGTFVPWKKESHSGIRIQEGPTGVGAGRVAPQNVTIDDANVRGQSSGYDFGLLNTGGTDVHVRGLRAMGFKKAAAAGVPTAQ
jgi:hypothetical protein